MEIKQLKQIKAHRCLFAGKDTEGNTSPEKSKDSRCLLLSLPKTGASLCYAMIEKQMHPFQHCHPLSHCNCILKQLVIILQKQQGLSLAQSQRI